MVEGVARVPRRQPPSQTGRLSGDEHCGESRSRTSDKLAAIPIPQGGARGGGGGGGGGILEVKYIKSRFCQVSKYA